MKIRGTAAHIAEKYMSLARDSLASGDMVSAESYLQHAEHYNRIIMAAQTQFSGQPNTQAGEGPNGGASYRNPRWHSDDEASDDDVGEGGGGEIRQGGGEHLRQGGGGQDRERHEGNREHHGGGGREGGGRERGRHGGNGREPGRDTNGSDQPEAHQPDETTPDPVS